MTIPCSFTGAQIFCYFDMHTQLQHLKIMLN